VDDAGQTQDGESIAMEIADPADDPEVTLTLNVQIENALSSCLIA
jgi:hypothetical protein